MISARITADGRIELIDGATKPILGLERLSPADAAALAQNILSCASAQARGLEAKSGAMVRSIPLYGDNWSLATVPDRAEQVLAFNLPLGIQLKFVLSPERARRLGAALAGGAPQKPSVPRQPSSKYDDATWHSGGEFPKGLPASAGGVHIGMFVAWAVLNGFCGDLHLNDGPDLLERLKSRTLTPGQWFLDACDGKFTTEDLSDEGNLFTASYYDLKKPTQKVYYIGDYEQLFGEAASLYAVPDTWESYDQLAPILFQRLAEWRRFRRQN